jgi:hypothetical protein
MDRYFIDCEFDGHGGPLLSLAMVAENGRGIHIGTTERASDPWVIANVVPLLFKHDASEGCVVNLNDVGGVIRAFVGPVDRFIVAADSPVDIGRFCEALSTGPDGGWASCDYASIAFEVHNVDCYPTTLEDAVQHNAWWDAMALRQKLLT